MKLNYNEKSGHKWHRQAGLVDQSLIFSMKLNIGGDDESLLALLIQLNQLGASRIGKGSIVIMHNPEEVVKTSLLRGLLNSEISNNNCTWSDLQSYFKNEGMEINFSEHLTDIDIWIDKPRMTYDEVCPKLWLIHGNGKALLGSEKLPQLPETFSGICPTFIDAATLISGISSLLHIFLKQNSYFWKQPISDSWLTLTTRIDDISPQESLEIVSSKYGTGIANLTNDGLGTLVRFRIPLEDTPIKLFDKLIMEHQEESNLLSNYIDVGPFNSIDENNYINFSSSDLPKKIKNSNFLILGVGGLGSWAIPSIISGCDKSTISLTIIDGDEKVEIHNLNRQILYDYNSINKSKVDAAKQKLIERFDLPAHSIISICDNLSSDHLSKNKNHYEHSITLDAAFEVDNSKNHIKIMNSLDNMDVALACLDNQYSRTVLNKACYERKKPMINGGGEASQGLIEFFHENCCMICRYGEEEAFSLDKVSCQEEGIKPVNSIVTTTAFVGSMMAASALCALAKQQGYEIEMPVSRDWSDGLSSLRLDSKLPWLDEKCQNHI